MSRIIRGVLKLIGAIVGGIISIPFIMMAVLGKIAGRYAEVSVAISKIPFYAGEYARLFYYKATLKSVGRNVRFKYGSFCQYADIKIGNDVLIGYNNSIGLVNIGNDVLFGGHVDCVSGLGQHGFDDPKKKIREHTGKRQHLNIGNDVWIGNHAIVAANIADRCVVGAGSVVIKDVSAKTVVAGNPAQKIKALK